MHQPDERDQTIRALRDRLTKLSEASLRINESLEFDTVLQGVLDSACSLTGARFGVIAVAGDAGEGHEFVTSGFTPEEVRGLWNVSWGAALFEYLTSLAEPLRVRDFQVHVREQGLPEFLPPVQISAAMPLMAAPITYYGDRMGIIFVADRQPGPEFAAEDEETLVMFASQAGLVIANARKHREERRARVDLETLIDTSPVGVVVFDARTGTVLSLNREAGRIVEGLRNAGDSLEDLLKVITVRRADGSEMSLQDFPLADFLSEGEPTRAEEITVEVADGRSVSVLINATPIRSDEGQTESVVVTLQDMTPLEEMDRLRAEFLGMVSHELRTPLTSIRGSATAMLDATEEVDPAELHQFLRIIVDQADNMRELIGDLLDVARIETGSLQVSPEPVEVAVLVDRARNTFLSAGGRDSLEIDLAPDLPLVMADRRRIVQVIGNLLSNAARHSPESSVIRVEAVRENVHVEVAVADEGRGIPAERLPYLFRKFSSIGAEDTGGDTGLGLAICKGIVESHGGRIWAESGGPGMGARFVFTIPAVEGSAVERRRPSWDTDREAPVGAPVLVIDDDPQTLRFVRKALSDAGYVPIVTADPEETLPLVEKSRPHLVLLDLMLPGVDGIDLMRDILDVTDVPIIFISAYGRDRVIARAFDLGAADYVVKPFSSTELTARIRAALRRHATLPGSELSEPYVLGELTIDYSQRLVTVAGRPVQLTATEYQLLLELSVNAGRVVTHELLLRRVWRPGKQGDVRALRTHLRRLRRKLGEDASNPTYIFAEPRVGYRMAKGGG